MALKLHRVETQVPLRGDEDVTIGPEDPWPSAYRGSKYSLVQSRKHNKLVMAWQYDDVTLYLERPSNLEEAMRSVGKSDGNATGSFRVTAGKEVLTKVQAKHYEHTELAPVDQGWVPVYLGQLEGDLGFTGIEIDPPLSKNGSVAVWEGLPFNHGETWAVSVNDVLIWKRQGYRRGYRFTSAFDHSELIDRYKKYRTIPGRLYINEYGHVWGNVPTDEVPRDRRDTIQQMYRDWKKKSERENKTDILRLVRRRLKATGGGDPSEGHLPVYFGHISQFDDGKIPRPIVDDTHYFVDEGRDAGV